MYITLIIICVLFSIVWGYYYFIQRDEGNYRILIITVLTTLAGSCLFQLFDYGILKIARYIVIMNGLILIAHIDRQKMIIPNRILVILSLVRLVLLIVEGIVYSNTEYLREVIVSPFLGFLIGGGLFFICYFLSRNSLGAGDVKLFAVIGLYVGAGILFPVMMLSALFSAVYGLLMVALHKIGMKDSIPFAPFAAVGTITALILGF